MFNRKTWISMKQVWGSGSFISTDLASAIQGPDLGSGGAIQGHPNQKTEEPPIPDAGLKCTSFGWISSWKATSSTPYGGRATEAYLKEHPEEAEAVHVVMS